MPAFPPDFWYQPPAPRKIYFVGICGIAMGQLALALHRRGWQVAGCDHQTDPPMVDLLQQAGIQTDPLDSAEPVEVDLWIVGRSVAAHHPFFQKVAGSPAPVLSFPQALASLLAQADRRWVVVGSKGKTTTTAMLTWIADRAGLKPDYLIGGMPGNFTDGLRLEAARLAILEGDEYASSPTDLTPKFAHYQPTDALVTNVFPDHIELYRDVAEYRKIFSTLLATLPANGTAVIAGDATAGVGDLHAAASCKVLSVGFEPHNPLCITDFSAHPKGTHFRFLKTSFHLPLLGRANALDAALAVVAAEKLGIAPAFSAEIMQEFLPVQDRLIQTGSPGGVLFYVESNVHPDALDSALAALRESHPSGHLFCVAQPQYPGPGNGYVQKRLGEVLARASHALIAPVAGQKPDDYDPPFSTDRLVDDLLQRHVDATFQSTRKGIVSWIVERALPGDTLLLAVHPPSRPYLLREISAALAAREPAPSPP